MNNKIYNILWDIFFCLCMLISILEINQAKKQIKEFETRIELIEMELGHD